MISLRDFTIKKINTDDSNTQFEIGPLPKGYGHTMGNILRRILLSSVPGSAITAVQLAGVQHEYSTVSGLSDDILALLLSLKNIVVISKSNSPVTLEIEVNGKAGSVVEVKASDIKKNTEVEIVNKDYVITKLTGNTKFKAKLVVTNGVGYKFPDQEVRKELGMLPVDAHFSPVILVPYEIVPTRVGQETELDQLNITVQTNGSMPASEALAMASTIFSEMSSNLLTNAEALLSGKSMRPLAVTASETQSETRKDKKSLKVSELNLSTRLTNALLRSSYDDLNKLEDFTEEELANIKGMGKKSLDELLAILKKNGIKIL